MKHTTRITIGIATVGLAMATSTQAALVLLADTTEPVSAPIEQSASNTNIGTDSGDDTAVGQTFTTVGALGMTGLTLIKGSNHSFSATGNATLRLQIFEWTGADANTTTDWTDAPEGGSNISGMTSLYNETVDLQGESYTALDYMHFDLGETISLSATTAYGFLFNIEGVTAGADNINFRQATTPSNPYSGGLRLNTTSAANNSGTSQDLAFYVNAVPEPSRTILLGFGGLALILRRRR